ncbi:MAG TPA: TRAP transporter small permease [Ramlibacter sp.]|jgi:TRAP-type C4-dicarboxylate transport system permease small subunit|uniref:TRAP transporter small permease n=1 Tax=Ramlibacter sp. TaxID=1917967 RepID=UPI002D499CB7|nr:TRAP transporter small permease [Ramlibacter sp.]HZY18108.1 TRAP transporter small permease [Ramlibacter sp.]
MAAGTTVPAAAPVEQPAAVPVQQPAPPRAGAVGPFTRLCAGLARASLFAAVLLLIAVVLCVQWQVVGRYLLNDTPTWAENLAMLLVLFVTAFGLAVGVRDAGHLGLESLVVLLPVAWQRRIALLVHALVAVFGGLMVYGGWVWAAAKWGEKKPMLPVPDGIDYVPIILAGALIVLFSIEHIVALLRGIEVEAAWN